MKAPALPTPEDLSLPQIMKRFPDEESAIGYLEAIRWSNGPVCPHCQNADASKIWNLAANAEKKIRVGLKQCAECKKQFRVTVGTIYEDSHIPLNLWIIATYLLAGAKKGMSALQLQRHLGLGSYKSAWFMSHRIRYAMTEAGGDQMGGDGGVVEVDETYVGGKRRKSGKPGRPGPNSNKTAVVSLVQRGGKKRSTVVDRVTAKNLLGAINGHVAAGSTVMTDEFSSYRNVKKNFAHGVVNHREGEYCKADGHTHTNTVESSFSLLKRGIVGSFHHISRKHLPLYLAEFDFRWNRRKDKDGERCVDAMKQAEGKRLTYRPLTKAN